MIVLNAAPATSDANRPAPRTIDRDHDPVVAPRGGGTVLAEAGGWTLGNRRTGPMGSGPIGIVGRGVGRAASRIRETRSTAGVARGGANGNRARASSATSAYRALGSFFKHWTMTASSPAGTSGRVRRTAGTGSLPTMKASSAIESAAYGGQPTSNSNKMMPSAQMSVRASMFAPARICSGAM
jgi:hypothetical protein